MSRTNLFRILITTLLAVSASAPAQAQLFGDLFNHDPLHVPRARHTGPQLDYYNGQPGRLWESEQPIENFIGQLARRSWIRIEYLHWDFDGIDGDTLGAPVLALDPINPLITFDNLNGGVSTGVGVFPGVDRLNLDDVPGLRGTWGLDLNGADLEVEFFGTRDTDTGFVIPNISAFRPITPAVGTVQRPNIVIPLLSSGAPTPAAATNFMIFDNSFAAETESRLWGTEITILSDRTIPGPGFGLQWLGGFRYLSYDEDFGFRGVFDNGGTLAVPLVNEVNANTINNIYGPEIGFRASIEHPKFRVSATPRVAFALNDFTAETNIVSLRGNPNPVDSADGDVDFTPVVQVSLNAEVHLSDHFSIYGGYDFLWLFRITRPVPNLVFDSTPGLAGAPVPAVNQSTEFDTFFSQGLSFGCQLRY